tara:strand:+ start:841 stop:1104 length:264 start_codon:yes stop_codon:yes gene_type:complete
MSIRYVMQILNSIDYSVAVCSFMPCHPARSTPQQPLFFFKILLFNNCDNTKLLKVPFSSAFSLSFIVALRIGSIVQMGSDTVLNIKP